jgi:hypothetical protein
MEGPLPSRFPGAGPAGTRGGGAELRSHPGAGSLAGRPIPDGGPGSVKIAKGPKRLLLAF